MDLFEHLNNICVNKQILDPKNEEDYKNYNVYMINRYISMVEIYLPLVNEINKYPNLPKEVHQRFYLSTLPKRKHFFPYIKKPKEVNIEEKRYIADFFEVGLKEADNYLKFLSEEIIEKILNLYKYGQNQKVDI